MPLALPAADSTRLLKSPLEVVVAQIRYEDAPLAGEASVALAIHEMLGGPNGPYPDLAPGQTQSVQFTLSQGQAPPAELPAPLPTWRFVSRDAGWTVSLTSNFVALETTRYTTWAGDFRERFAALIDAVATHLRPVFNPRVGVRYIDRIAELKLHSAAEWERYVTPELLGAARHPVLGPAVREAQQQLVVEIDEDISCNLRHGLISEDDRLDYLMDFDVYRQGVRAFDADDIKQTADTLNDYALRLFQVCVTPELLKELR